MLEISKNFQGRHFSPNPVGGTYLKATFSQLPCVKISSKSVKRSSSYIDSKFSRSSLAFVCECSAWPLKRNSSLFCCTMIQHKTSIIRRTSHHNTLHTNARLDLENFEWLYLGDRLSDLDKIRTGGSWAKVALENVPPHEFGLKWRPWKFFEISQISNPCHWLNLCPIWMKLILCLPTNFD
jgi:hypothetical protein